MTDAQALAIVESCKGFPLDDRHPQQICRWWKEPDSVQVIDGVVTVQLTLASQCWDYVEEHLSKLFGVSEDRVRTTSHTEGCDTCGYGTTGWVEVRLDEP